MRPYIDAFNREYKNIVCVFSSPNKFILKWLSEQNNIILYTNAQIRQNGITTYPIGHKSYYENVSSAKAVVCDGNPMVLSDAYYAKKYSVIFNKFDNLKTLDVYSMMNKNATVYNGFGEYYPSTKAIDLDLSNIDKKITTKSNNSAVISLTEYLKNRFSM
jgi:hypothetical protein